MFPGMNPKQMKQAMKQLGIKQEELSASEVIIRLSDREIVLTEPSVQKINMSGQWSYQISGNESVRSLDSTPEITADDVKTVMDQANCSEEEAKAALEETKGDIAEAILKFQ